MRGITRSCLLRLRNEDVPVLADRLSKRFVSRVKLTKLIRRKDERRPGYLHGYAIEREGAVYRFLSTNDTVATDHAGLDHVAVGQFDHEGNHAAKREVDRMRAMHRLGQCLALI